jgi:predicted metalloprotease with PDZ domain
MNRRTAMFAALSCLAILAACQSAPPVRGEIRYLVAPIGDDTRVKVTMKFEAEPGPIELQMPDWSPGAYDLAFHGRKVSDFQWLDAAGAPIAFRHDRDDTWSGTLAKAGETTLEYTVPAHFEAGALHFGGPSTYLYVVGRKEEPCRLSLGLPPGWKVAVGLDPVGASPTEYAAPDYDVLADSPVTAGDFIDLHYTSHGKPMTIALRGDLRAKVDPDKIVKLCQTVSDCEGDFFGELPFHKYVWHCMVFGSEDGGGGLEHLSSTQIALAQGVGPLAARVCAHEFFHLWNVKRIRSKPLGPFDYTKLPRTGALYWLEGVTDYYASLFLTRSGYLGEEAFLKDLADNVRRARSNPARLEVSPYESSLRVGEANDGLGNGGGWRVSFYELGWLAGLCLDVDLRVRTNGARSLDDVELALWSLCKDGRPGFEEGEIERQYVRAGGSGEFFEKVVMKPGEMPVEEALERLGLHLERSEQTFVDKGFDTSTTVGSPKISVDSPRPFATAAGLAENDVLLEVNGHAVLAATMRESLAKMGEAMGEVKAGDALRLKVDHAGVEKEITITAVTASSPVFKVVADEPADATRLALRHALEQAAPRR